MDDKIEARISDLERLVRELDERLKEIEPWVTRPKEPQSDSLELE